MRPIDGDALINTLQELFDKREKEARFTGDRSVTVTWNDAIYHIKTAPTIEAATCEGCKHLGKWDDEYGYPSSCTRCKRMVEDNYERLCDTDRKKVTSDG